MCLFLLPNNSFKSVAYRKGVREFDCGACPECLRKRSNVWALRSVYEAKAHLHNCMITLTYDTFKYNDNGECIGENPVNPFLEVNKRHIQLFIKRLRKWWSTVSSEKIKYLCCAEYGSRTHRAHYHLILFGVKFPDIHYYKKSKRGNVIYMSNILTRLWSHGICTVDSINVHSGVARYCTKYCAKSRSDKSFMLCSQGIGLSELIKDFNGRSYFIDGREYPIPKMVWQFYIMNKYKYRRYAPYMSFKYVNRCKDFTDIDSFNYDLLRYDIACKRRKLYYMVRDNDSLYKSYIKYWSSKVAVYDQNKPSVIQRIYLLDDSKYHFYKSAALACYRRRREFVPVPAPGSNCKTAYCRWLDERVSYAPRLGHLSLPSRPITTSDTKKDCFWLYDPFNKDFFTENEIKLFTKSYSQCIIDLSND